MANTKLLIECKDEIGLIARVTDVLYKKKINIIVNDNFTDLKNKRFYIRIEFDYECDHEALSQELREVLPVEAKVSIAGPDKKKLVIMATREPYCLGELLVRCVYGDMNAEVLAVVANNSKLGFLADGFRAPFYNVPHKGKSREEHEAEVFNILDQLDFNFLVLAKYMRILTPEFIQRYRTERIINIHHSFLPAFIGAKPYKQAYDRGVKIIGATSHFVTENLDEGPIIVQDVTHVEHTHSARDMERAGRAVEKRVLAKAMNLVIEDRVFISGNKTIIFE